MKNSLARLLSVPALTLFFLITADAALVDNGILTTDTNTGLVWRDLADTFAVSYSDTYNATLPGGVYENYRVATRSELETLFDDYYGDSDLWSLWGQSVIPITGVYFDDPANNEIADEIVSAAVILNDGTSTMNGGQWSIYESGQGISTALVQVQPVPLPGSAYLFLTALCGLIGISRRKNTA